MEEAGGCRQSRGLKALVRMYANLLRAAPVWTKSLTSGIIFGASDLVAQRIEDSGLDMPRFTMSTVVGLCYFGPAAHIWYNNVQRLFPRSTLGHVLLKTALGQALFGPVFIFVYFSAALVADGGTVVLLAVETDSLLALETCPGARNFHKETLGFFGVPCTRCGRGASEAEEKMRTVKRVMCICK